MLEKVSSGEHLLGYNVLGSYALVRAKKDPGLGVVLPKDYTLVLSRVMFIGKKAKQPERGEALGRLHPLAARPEADRQRRGALLDARRRRGASTPPPSSKAELGDKVKPIPVGGEITEYLDSKKRLEFLGNWKASLDAGAQVDGGPADAMPRGQSLPGILSGARSRSS